MKVLRLPATHPTALRCLRLAVPRATRFLRSLADECTAEAWSWLPGVSFRDRTEEVVGSPKFLENLNCPFARVLTDTGGTAFTKPLRSSNMAPGPPGAKAPTKGLSMPNSTAESLIVDRRHFVHYRPPLHGRNTPKWASCSGDAVVVRIFVRDNLNRGVTQLKDRRVWKAHENRRMSSNDELRAFLH